VGQLGDANEVLNERAVAVMARMKHKLTGCDFSPSSVYAGNSTSTSVLVDQTAVSGDRDSETGLSVSVQVQKLIDQAMSHENLCQNYVGYVSLRLDMLLMLVTVYIKFPIRLRIYLYFGKKYM
jgi:FKBP12-rapamycin complex-associated protein